MTKKPPPLRWLVVHPYCHWVVWACWRSGGVGRQKCGATGRSRIRTTDDGDRFSIALSLLAAHSVSSEFQMAVYSWNHYVRSRSTGGACDESEYAIKCSSRSEEQANSGIHDLLFLWKRDGCHTVNLDVLLGGVAWCMYIGGVGKHNCAVILEIHTEPVYSRFFQGIEKIKTKYCDERILFVQARIKK